MANIAKDLRQRAPYHHILWHTLKPHAGQMDRQIDSEWKVLMHGLEDMVWEEVN